MAKKLTLPQVKETLAEVNPLVAATLTGIIYQAKLFNQQARINVPEEEVVTEVISLWRIVTNALSTGTVPGV